MFDEQLIKEIVLKYGVDTIKSIEKISFLTGIELFQLKDCKNVM